MIETIGLGSLGDIMRSLIFLSTEALAADYCDRSPKKMLVSFKKDMSSKLGSRFSPPNASTTD